ncbi:MAG: sulfite exporter TauE/SafE family protein [Flavobacteriaceae bacterium]|nr:sulfite exporter TauE/SafE family protein [Flavobacteriaceae bacterium]
MFLSAFLLGLAGGFHCIGMCGPIAFILPINKETPVKMVFQTILYHLGRLLTYSFIGLLFGLLGKGLSLAGIQQQLSIVIGILMIAIFFIPFNKLLSINIAFPISKIVMKLKKKLGTYLNRKSNTSIFIIGILNGFLPCGLVYMAVIGSIAMASAYSGAFYMFLFGLGTIPLMTGAIYLGNFINIAVRNKIQKMIPVFVVIIGILFILRGLGLGIPLISPPNESLKIENPAKCHH